MFHAPLIVFGKRFSSSRLCQSFLLVVLSSIFIGLFAKIAIPLPFTPIPIATQGIVILILSSLLGTKRAVGAVFGFLFQGAIGLPVFAGGVGGLALFFGPRGGYLLGYLAAAFLVGYLSERMKERGPIKLFFILGSGNAVILLFGVFYFAGFVGWQNALLLGFFPFVLGDILKLVVGVRILEPVNNRQC